MGIAETGVGRNRETVDLGAVLIVVAITELQAESPLVAQIVTDFGLDGKAGMIVIKVSPESDFASKVNLCAGCRCNQNSYQTQK